MHALVTMWLLGRGARAPSFDTLFDVVYYLSLIVSTELAPGTSVEMAANYNNNLAVQNFVEYLRIPSVQPNINYGELFIWIYLYQS